MNKKAILLILGIALATTTASFSVSAKEISQQAEELIENQKISCEVNDSTNKETNILNIRAEEDTVAKSHEVWVNISLENINEGNKEFAITNLKDIEKQIVEVKYDPKKLEYYGSWTGSRSFMLYGTSHNKESGLIKLTILCEDIPYAESNIVNSLFFKAVEEGETEVSIESATIYNEKQGYNLTEAQKGKAIIKITK